MRREEAEQEAAWRNVNDERSARLEFYAFDASAGLADDAWEVTMRLRRDGGGEVAAPRERPRRREPAVEPAPALPVEDVAGLDPPPRAPERRRPPGRPRRAAEPRARRPRAGRQQRIPRPSLPRRRRRGEEDIPPPRAPWLTRLARFVGGGVILVAILWVGLTTALAILIQATSPSGLAIYALAVVVGLLTIGLGVAIRRS
jgi:hypothetical protein